MPLGILMFVVGLTCLVAAFALFVATIKRRQAPLSLDKSVEKWGHEIPDSIYYAVRIYDAAPDGTYRYNEMGYISDTNITAIQVHLETKTRVNLGKYNFLEDMKGLVKND